ncbi:carbohydrate-binding module 48 family protein, partial [Chlamydia psittaci 06-1683]
MGAIPYDVQGISGVLFVVWAPHAQRVSVVGDFNFWNGLVNPLRKVSDLGVWELFIPGLEEGTLYKWEIVSASG